MESITWSQPVDLVEHLSIYMQILLVSSIFCRYCWFSTRRMIKLLSIGEKLLHHQTSIETGWEPSTSFTQSLKANCLSNRALDEYISVIYMYLSKFVLADWLQRSGIHLTNDRIGWQNYNGGLWGSDESLEGADWNLAAHSNILFQTFNEIQM